jgi:prolipoprotein diacylglyceryltransferase
MVALCLLFGITRYGCHLEGCCHGTPAPVGFPGIVYPHDTPGYAPAPSLRGIPLHPAALYECVGLLVFALVGGLFLRSRAPRPGHAGWGMLGGYAVLRLLVELVRADERGWESFPLSPSQVISLAILVVGVADLGLGWTRWPTFPWRKDASSEMKNS